MQLKKCPECGTIDVIATGHREGCAFAGKTMEEINSKKCRRGMCQAVPAICQHTLSKETSTASSVPDRSTINRAKPI